MWFHSSCVGFKTHPKVLGHDNLMYFCDPCKEITRDMWKSHRSEKEEKSVQTEEKPQEDRCCQTEEDVTGPQPSRHDEGVQTESVHPQSGPRQQQQQQQTTVRMRRKKAPIRIIGDSMVKMMHSQVKCRMQGSGCTSLRGAKITDIRKKVEEEADSLKDGMLIIQGGGNGLEFVGEDETVRNVVDAVKSVEGKGMSVAVVGVMQRPREGPFYERLRRTTNRRIQEELLRMKIDWMKEKKGKLSFIDMDGVVDRFSLYAEDGVHLNNAGTARMGRRLCEWVRARSLQPMDQ